MLLPFHEGAMGLGYQMLQTICSCLILLH